MLFSLLKLLQLLVSKFEKFIMQLKASFTVLPIKKKSPKETGETGTRKLPINLQSPDFARSRTARAKTTYAL